MKKVIHISPTLPPIVNGLGDFCKILAKNLECDGFIENIFLVRTACSDQTEHNVYTFQSSTFYEILSAQKADVIILHYVGYAYNRYALPFYLLSGLQRLKRKFKCRLLVFFHEIYSSSSSFLKLPFYTEWLQRLIIRKLMTIADKAFTNCSRYRVLLDEIMGRRTQENLVECTGIFSNIPEDLFNANVSKEEKTLVVFGSCNNRRLVYRNRSFPQLLERLGIDTILDIGPGESGLDNCTVPVVKMRVLASDSVALHFNRAKYGALSYPPHLLGKSGIFSAYAAFGLIPLNLTVTDGALGDGLVEGRNYFTWKPETTPDIFNYDTARDEILKWYHTHDQKTITERFKTYL